MCTVLLPPDVNPIAVNKYIISHIISYHIISSYIVSYIISYHIIIYIISYITSYLILHVYQKWRGQSLQTVGAKYGEASPLLLRRGLSIFTPTVCKERLLPIYSSREPVRCLMMTDYDSRNI